MGRREKFKVIWSKLDGTKFLIDKGMKDGYSRGDRVLVFERPIEIHDPEDGTHLDTIQRFKFSAEITFCWGHCSICTPLYTNANIGDQGRLESGGDFDAKP